MGWKDVGYLAGVIPGLMIESGFAEKSAKDAEARQYERNANLAKIEADQDEAARRDDLLATLGAIDAVRTARGLDVASPTGMAIIQERTARAERSIRSSRINFMNQAIGYKTAAQISGIQGDVALMSGFLNAGQFIASQFKG